MKIQPFQTLVPNKKLYILYILNLQCDGIKRYSYYINSDNKLMFLVSYGCLLL